MIDFLEAMDWCKATDDDGPVVEALCVAATEIVQRETGLYAGLPQAVTEVFTSFPPLMLRGVPSGALVLEEWSGGGWVTVAGAQYFVDADILRAAPGWTPPASVRLRATYTTGFDAGAAPRDLQIAALGLVANLFENRGDGHMQPGTAGHSPEIPGWVQQILRLHRRVAV